MMNVLLTQRVDLISHYQERRDSLDQRWIELISECNMVPILVPNHLEAVQRLLNQIKVGGIVFTGGNDLVEYGGNAPERDITEKFLLKNAIANRIPVLGVCRGMQVIQNYFGVKLYNLEGHVATRHKISLNGTAIETNSYHSWGTKETTGELEVIARTADGVIEAIKHRIFRIAGVMWHPERENPYTQVDRQMITSALS